MLNSQWTLHARSEFLFECGGEKEEALPESPQSKVLKKSILLSLSLAKMVFLVRASVYYYTDGHNQARCSKHTSIRLGSKLYLSNMPRMLNKGLTRSMQSLSRTQNWARERTASSSRFPIWRRHIRKHEDPGDDVVSLLRIFV